MSGLRCSRLADIVVSITSDLLFGQTILPVSSSHNEIALRFPLATLRSTCARCTHPQIVAIRTFLGARISSEAPVSQRIRGSPNSDPYVAQEVIIYGAS